MKLKNYISENILLIDGAMGTYYSQKYRLDDCLSENANTLKPDQIRDIHIEYIKAGSKLIRTNTFAANTVNLEKNIFEIKENITAAINIAKEAATKDIYIAGSIGPINDSLKNEKEIIEEYKIIIDVFLENKIEILWFETFSDPKELLLLIDYAASKKADVEIAAMFSINNYGFTNSGMNIQDVLNSIEANDNILIHGFNCGSGPGHLLSHFRTIDISQNAAAVPNSGFPDTVMSRTVYSSNIEYFSECIRDMVDLGISIIGGCCGTTPGHIKKISEFSKTAKKSPVIVSEKQSEKIIVEIQKNSFIEKLKNNEQVIAVELDPPYNLDISKMMNGVFDLQNTKIDLLTVADSPLGRSRIDSIMTAAKIKREFKIDVMPHVCCRDRNMIAMKSMMLGAHVENIRNFLFITGDPVPAEQRSQIKSVFNFNSITLMKLISQMNESFFNSDQIFFGGAINPNIKETENLIERVKNKQDAGCSYFLTQPIYSIETAEKINEIQSKTNSKILIGIMPLVSYRNAQFLHNEFPGIVIPQFIQDSFSNEMTRNEAEERGIEISNDIIDQISGFADGYYLITPFSRTKMIKSIIDHIK